MDISKDEDDRIVKTGEVGFVFKFKEVTETIFFSDKDIRELAAKIERSIKSMNEIMPTDDEIENAPS